MNLRTLIVALLLAAFAAFVVVNWTAITAPTTLSLIFGTMQAPLGLILFGFTALIGGAFLLLLAYQQATVIVEARRTAKELNAQRRLADEAEASRFTELRRHLDESFQRLETAAMARQDALTQRINALEQSLHAQIEQSGNTLAAYVGELDDRVERLATRSGHPSTDA
ncbi:MAG: LapA family protein [Gemmatimonadota bacterium]